jgi:PTH1 family peptidyl-tRNA hydrolase
VNLIVGLGNSGDNYEGTRHNAGCRAVEVIAARWRLPLKDTFSYAKIRRGEVKGSMVMLARLNTYMNHSGDAITLIMARFRLQASGLLVVYDDMDLPLGTLRMRRQGGTGGHKGMGSIVAALGTQEFARLRVGIGRPPVGLGEVGYLLSPFTSEEEEILDKVYGQVAVAVECLLSEGIEVVMNRFN